EPDERHRDRFDDPLLAEEDDVRQGEDGEAGTQQHPPGDLAVRDFPHGVPSGFSVTMPRRSASTFAAPRRFSCAANSRRPSYQPVRATAAPAPSGKSCMTPRTKNPAGPAPTATTPARTRSMNRFRAGATVTPASTSRPTVGSHRTGTVSRNSSCTRVRKY